MVRKKNDSLERALEVKEGGIGKKGERQGREGREGGAVMVDRIAT